MYWEDVSILFAYPSNIRTAICTTNAMESLNSVIRYAIKNRRFSLTDDSVRRSFIQR